MRLDRRNYPPEHAIRVPYDALRGLVEELFLAANMAEADAELLATILTRNNQRCITRYRADPTLPRCDRERPGESSAGCACRE